jgi:hypothetical protein
MQVSHPRAFRIKTFDLGVTKALNCPCGKAALKRPGQDYPFAPSARPLGSELGRAGREAPR